MAGLSITLKSKSSTKFSFSWVVTLNQDREETVKYQLKPGSIKFKCNDTTIASGYSSLTGTTAEMFYTQWTSGSSTS